ncbi:MAG: hypothetical protein R3E65_06270 [Steroidobacteraceae bacterium]
MTSFDAGLPDAGIIEMRGGDPVHDRDEIFEIAADGDGYRIDSRIVARSGAYSLRIEARYSPDWLPRGLAGWSTTADHEGVVRIDVEAGEAVVMLAAAPPPGPLRLHCPTGTLIDLEPSTLPMWAMTRRYDRARGGTQVFRWIGRSLVRDVTLENLEVPLTLVRSDARGETFEFSETYPLPGGGQFTLPFTLQVDTAGRLQRFSVGTGARRVVGVRRPLAAGGPT